MHTSERLPLEVDFPRFSCFSAVERRDAERLRGLMVSEQDTFVVGSVLHWRSNNAVVPPFVYADAALVCPKVQSEAYLKVLGKTLKGFRKPRVREDVDPEMSFELDANFGVRTRVVNVLTGRRVR